MGAFGDLIPPRHFGGGSPDPDLQRVETEMGNVSDERALVRMPDARIRAIFALWLAGSTPYEIAEQLDIDSVPLVRMAIEKMLADSVDESEDRTMERHRVSLQLDRMLRSIFGKVLDSKSPDQLAYMRTALQILDRKARLKGLDAPVQISLTTPTADELQQFIRTVAIESGIPVPEEGDPFADEVVMEEGPDETFTERAD